MSLTAIVWVFVYAAGLLASFVNPVFGTFTYLFEYYFRPSVRWWGRALPELRYNFIVSAVLTLTYVARRSSQPNPGPLRFVTAKWLLGLAAVMLLVTPFAVSPSASWGATTDYLKFIMFHGLTVGTLRAEWMFDGFVALHIFGAGWWGWDVYQNPRRAAGRLVRAGSSDTLNDNFAAAHLLTVIPFAVVYLVKHRDWRLRLLALAALPFIINMFILCNSRGATLGLIASTLASVAMAAKGHRVRMLGVCVAFLLGALTLADPEFISRQQTATDLSDPRGGAGRLAIWKEGLGIVGDYPLGAGGKGFSILSPDYIPREMLPRDADTRAAHNTYLLVASEWGVLGLAIFLAYFGSVLRATIRIQRQVARGDIWYYRALAIQAGVVGLLVAGTFSDRLYAEAPYWVGALAVSLDRLYAQHAKDTHGAASLTVTPKPSSTRGGQQ